MNMYLPAPIGSPFLTQRHLNRGPLLLPNPGAGFGPR
jgi:hypothetical protein